MVLDTVHSRGVGRMHGGMKIARPFQDAKFMLTTDTVVENKKGSGVESKSRPGLVIRRRIMVRHADEVAGGPPTPALSSLSLTAHENSPKHQQSDIVRYGLYSTVASHFSVDDAAVLATPSFLEKLQGYYNQ